MCGYCNGYDDDVFLGEEKFAFNNLGPDHVITCEISFTIDDEENSGARISARANVFGADFHSKKIKINYCPFCGRKL